MSSEALERAIRAVLDDVSGAAVASDTRVHLARAALDAVLAEVARLEQERDEAQRESSAQMSAKLEAQMALAAITEGLDLRLADLGNGWTEGAVKILARIETIVDEGERGFAALAVAREREQRALEVCARPIFEVEEQGLHVAATGNAYGLAKAVRAALVDEPAAATLAEPGAGADKGATASAVSESVRTPSGSASAAADEPGEPWCRKIQRRN